MDLKCVSNIKCDQGAIRSVRFNVDGEYCLTCGSDKKIKLWNPFKELCLKTYAGHGDCVMDACGSCDSSELASCGADKSVVLWDVSDGRVKRRLRQHAAAVNCVEYNEDSSVVVSGSNDNTVCCWDTRSRNNSPIQVLKEAKDSITKVLVIGHQILTGSLDCFLRTYDIRMGNLDADFIGKPISCISSTQDNMCTLVSCTDSTLKLMDRQKGELLNEYTGHTVGDYFIENCVFHNDSIIISGSTCGHLWCWDFVSAKVLEKLKPNDNVSYTQSINSISTHPSKKVLVASCGPCISLWSE
ncbi:unnamed protein product [Macrosiphum euphorbiae]|uniref:WD repeat domain-containing protein 83 n=1 Tax=Macrosiphum euphorbiae TaxID=13131 RepID=A0AAV0X908_9HEMI|nr:WD repeat domain-containing protein 83 [Metopolophium dirhodum]CAI6364688.1 unnamed protein product [Macrosiphum euphorbiae]